MTFKPDDTILLKDDALSILDEQVYQSLYPNRNERRQSVTKLKVMAVMADSYTLQVMDVVDVGTGNVIPLHKTIIVTADKVSEALSDTRPQTQVIRFDPRGEQKKPQKTPSIDPQRFLKYVVKAEDGCWLWQGPRSGRYGTFSWDKERGYVLAHRAAYELFISEVPSGIQFRRHCGNSLCVNPAHMALSSQ